MTRGVDDPVGNQAFNFTIRAAEFPQQSDAMLAGQRSGMPMDRGGGGETKRVADLVDRASRGMVFFNDYAVRMQGWFICDFFVRER